MFIVNVTSSCNSTSLIQPASSTLRNLTLHGISTESGGPYLPSPQALPGGTGSPYWALLATDQRGWQQAAGCTGTLAALGLHWLISAATYAAAAAALRGPGRMQQQ